MLKVRLKMRNVVAIAICLAGSATMFAQEEIGVVINGVTWATRNVDEVGTFAENPESAGKFYQWNRNAAWAVTGDVTDWDIPTSDVTEWEKANDPSPLGWHVPTLVDIDKLLDTEKVKKELWIENGIHGWKFTDKTNDNSIFLPRIGYRTFDSGTLNSNPISYYWSSVKMVDISDAHCLWLNAGLANRTAINIGHGFNIRCVADEANTSVSKVSADKASIVGYYDLLGRKQKEEPTTGIYIIQYDNGTTKKVMR